MNKFLKGVIAVFAGINRMVYITTPIILGTIWVSISNINSFINTFFFVCCCFATLYRGVEIWIK